MQDFAFGKTCFERNRIKCISTKRLRFARFCLRQNLSLLSNLPAFSVRGRNGFRLPSPPRRTFCASILSMPRAQKHNLADCFYGKPARPVCRRAVRDLHAPQPCRRSSAALGRVPPHAARRKCRAVCRPSRIRLICFALRHTPIARFRQTANFPHCGALPARQAWENRTCAFQTAHTARRCATARFAVRSARGTCRAMHSCTSAGKSTSPKQAVQTPSPPLPYASDGTSSEGIRLTERRCADGNGKPFR